MLSDKSRTVLTCTGGGSSVGIVPRASHNSRRGEFVAATRRRRRDGNGTLGDPRMRRRDVIRVWLRALEPVVTSGCARAGKCATHGEFTGLKFF